MSHEPQPQFEFKIAITGRVIVLICCLPVSIIGIVLLAEWVASLWAVLLYILLIVGVVIKLLKPWAFKKEKISFWEEGFKSAVYGRIAFSEILEAASPWYMAKPSLKLYLRSGKSCSWALWNGLEVQKALKGQHPFSHFLDMLQQRLEAYESKAATFPSESRKTPTEIHTSEAAPATPESYSPQPQQVASQLGGLKELSRKPGVTIPIGLAFAVLALVRSCGADWFKRDDINLSSMHESSAKLYDHYVEEAKTILDRKLETEGKLFLYTNDTAATATLYPEIETANPTGIAAFEYNSAIESIREFVQNPDSVELQIYVMGGDKSVQKMGLSMININDSTSQYLYLRAYDPKQKIKPITSYNSQTATDSSHYRTFDILWGVPLTDTTQNLQYAINTSMPGMHMMLAQVRHRQSFKFYMCGREKQGVDEVKFRQSIQALNHLLHKVQADTSGFVLKVSNGK